MLQEGREVVIVVGDLAVTDRIMNDALWVGVYPGLSDQMLEHVCRSIAGAVGGQG